MSSIGQVAKCCQGATGLVTFVSKIKGRLFYTGICLDTGRAGQSWKSLNPEWIGTLDDWVKLRHAEIA